MPSVIATEFDFDHITRLPLNTPTEFRLEDGTEGLVTVLENEYVDSSRWYEIHRIVWHEHHGNTYAYDYEIPATEYQEGSESEFDPSQIYEVTARLVQVIQYTKKTA